MNSKVHAKNAFYYYKGNLMELFADERARGLDDIRLKIYLDIIECIQDPQSRAGNHLEPESKNR